MWSEPTEQDNKSPWGIQEPTKDTSIREFGRAKTRHPQGGNVPNEEIQDRREEEAGKPTDTLERNKEALKKTEQQESYKNAFLVEKTRELKTTLGGTADEILAKANNFLNKGKVLIDNKSTGQTVYNKETKNWELGPDIQKVQEFDTVAVAKYNELKDLRRTADVFFVKDENGLWEPRQFKDVLATHYNNLDPDERMQVDVQTTKLIGLVEKINRLEQVGMQDSAEARGLRRQLALEDTSGAVSGLYEAKKAVEALLSGDISFYGDAGVKGTSVKDILNLNLEEIKAEIEKASAMSSGLFGGNYSMALKKALDKDSEEYQTFINEEAEFKNTVGQAGRKYFLGAQDKLLAMAQDISEQMKAVAPDLEKALTGDLGAYSDVAKAWFVALNEGDATDFVGSIHDIIFDPDSGIVLEERVKLAKLIGDVLKAKGVDLGNLEEDALITNAMVELEDTGRFTWINEDGTKITLNPNGAQKASILHASTLGPDKLKEVFLGIVEGSGMDLETTIKGLVQSKSYAALPRVIDGFKNSVIESLGTLKGSDTEKTLISEALGNAPTIRQAYNKGELSEAQVNGVVLEYIKTNPKIVQGFLDQRWDDRFKEFKVQHDELVKQANEIAAVYAKSRAETKASAVKTSAVVKELDAWEAKSEATLKALIQDSIPSAKESLKEGNFLTFIHNKYPNWSAKELDTRADEVARGIAAISVFRGLRQQDPEMFEVANQFLVDKYNVVKSEGVFIRGMEDLRKVSLPTMEDSYRQQLILNLFEHKTGDYMFYEIEGVLEAASYAHPQVYAAIREVLSYSDKIKKANEQLDLGAQEVKAQLKLLAELDESMLQVGEVFSPKQVAAAAVKMARALIDDGVAPLQSVDMGGEGIRGKVATPHNALVGRGAYSTDFEMKGMPFTPTYTAEDLRSKIDLPEVTVPTSTTPTTPNGGGTSITKEMAEVISDKPVTAKIAPRDWQQSGVAASSTVTVNKDGTIGRGGGDGVQVEGFYVRSPETGEIEFFVNPKQPNEILEGLRKASSAIKGFTDSPSTGIFSDILKLAVNAATVAGTQVFRTGDNDTKQIYNKHGQGDSVNGLSPAQFNEKAAYDRDLGIRALRLSGEYTDLQLQEIINNPANNAFLIEQGILKGNTKEVQNSLLTPRQIADRKAQEMRDAVARQKGIADRKAQEALNKKKRDAEKFRKDNMDFGISDNYVPPPKNGGNKNTRATIAW